MPSDSYRDPKGCASFKVPVFAGRVVLALTRNNYAGALKKLEGQHTPTADSLRNVVGQTSTVTTKDGRVLHVIGVFEEANKTLVHELVHATFRILTECGVPISRRNDETFAYLMDALFSESQKAIARLRRRR